MNLKRVLLATITTGILAVTGCAGGNTPNNNHGNRTGENIGRNVNRAFNDGRTRPNYYDGDGINNPNMAPRTRRVTRSNRLGNRMRGFDQRTVRPPSTRYTPNLGSRTRGNIGTDLNRSFNNSRTRSNFLNTTPKVRYSTRSSNVVPKVGHTRRAANAAPRAGLTITPAPRTGHTITPAPNAGQTRSTSPASKAGHITRSSKISTQKHSRHQANVTAMPSPVVTVTPKAGTTTTRNTAVNPTVNRANVVNQTR